MQISKGNYGKAFIFKATHEWNFSLYSKWKREEQREEDKEGRGGDRQTDTGSWVFYLLTDRHKEKDGQALANS